MIDEYLIELVTRLEWNAGEYGSKPSPREQLHGAQSDLCLHRSSGQLLPPHPVRLALQGDDVAVRLFTTSSAPGLPARDAVENYSMGTYNAASNQTQLALTAQLIGAPANFSGGTLLTERTALPRARR